MSLTRIRILLSKTTSRMAQAGHTLEDTWVQTNKDHVYVPEEDDRSSISSYEAQAGVKGIEAISQTWTKWSLVFAYVGYELHSCLRSRGLNIAGLFFYFTYADVIMQNIFNGLLHVIGGPDSRVVISLCHQRVQHTLLDFYGVCGARGCLWYRRYWITRFCPAFN